ncbi:hypothetical protein ULMS_07500 [Patiriisocius marinistellae]|uniref:Uncharacterized protein n=1 Tax=Patiriisocius marinistellae TaxID=2494560 RepID=A0A5J4FVU2_9FLAO|nr:hypothetical protein [Patiriisocius marinistellae]GEQ85242.1 hypothetical protein ULMS_07500 [Patiriisocius marinistellae]
MKYLLILCLLIVTSVSAQNVVEVRKAYTSIENDKGAIESLYGQLEHIFEDKFTLSAYKGAVMTMLAKYEKGGKQKKAYFKNGVGLIENAIKAEPNNIELRTIRLSIQENAPKFLKYHSSIVEDKTFIIDNFKKTKSKEVCAFVKDYAMQSSSFTEEDKIQF